MSAIAILRPVMVVLAEGIRRPRKYWSITWRGPLGESSAGLHYSLNRARDMARGGLAAMRALTLWQPWASLIAYGGKRWETRSWRTDYRGELLIHAAQRQAPPIADPKFIEEAIQVLGHADFNVLPAGTVVAVCELTACYRITATAPQQADERELTDCMWLTYPHDISGAARELRFGDWSLDRYVWRLENVRRLVQPVPLKGQRRLFPLHGDTLRAVDDELVRAVAV
jgi:activating signal cointegrator 1